MFEAKFERLMAELGPDRFMAAYLATGARNGVEDLHVAGSFTDGEAPDFNRSMRNSLYEAWVALREGVSEERDNAQAFMDRCWRLLEELDEGLLTQDAMEDVLAGCCHRAARRFIEAKGESAANAHAFACAAVEEMRSYHRLWTSVVEGHASEQEMKQFDICVGLMATYWEPAELSREFAFLLEG